MGFIIAGGNRLHGVKSGDSAWDNGCLGATADNNIGVTILNGAHSGANTVAGCSTGRNRRKIRAFQIVFNGNIPGGNIDDHHGNKKRAHARRPFGNHLGVLVFKSQHATDTRADNYPDAITIFFFQIKAGIFNRLFRGDHCKLRKTIHAPRFLAIKIFQGIEVFNFTRDFCGKIRRIK